MKRLGIATAALLLLGMTAAFAGPRVAASISPINGDGAEIALPQIAGFSGTLTFPPNDAGAQTHVALRTSLEIPLDAPSELRNALTSEQHGAPVRFWLSAQSSDDVRFLPGDVGFEFHLRHLLANDSVQYYAFACDRATCKPRLIGPFFASGGRLAFSNKGTPLHFHFNVARGHEYMAAIFERRCFRGACN